jgi:hypothetical protein
MPTTVALEPKLRNTPPQFGIDFLKGPWCAFRVRLNLPGAARYLPSETPQGVVERTWVRWSLLGTRRASIDSRPA